MNERKALSTRLPAFLALLLSPAAVAATSVIATPDYAYCATEANDAMTIGRMAQVFHKDEAQLLKNPRLPERIQSLVRRFFVASRQPGFENYAQFASEVFSECAKARALPIEINAKKAFVCLTRVDIPYFYSLERQAGAAPEAATAKLEAEMAGWHYPDGLIRALAKPSYHLQSVQEQNDLQLFIFNSCYLPTAEVDAFYGANPP